MAFEDQHFTVTENHIKLLKRMIVSWDSCEFGAPAIDCKRPYGNSSVIYDIAEIIGYEYSTEDPDGEGEMVDEDYNYLRHLHEEMQTVLQIVLSSGSFAPGNYKSDWAGYEWSLVK